MPKSTEVTLDDVVLQLKITNRLLAAQLKGAESMKQIELVGLLANTGASAQDIADILNATPDTIRKSLSRVRLKPAKSPKAVGSSNDAVVPEEVDVVDA